jgi:hypothetical protein
MQVSRSLFPLDKPVAQIRQQLDEIARTGRSALMTFT